MKSQQRYDKTRSPQQTPPPPIKTTIRNMDEILEVINKKRDYVLRRSDEVSDQGDPLIAFQMRLVALSTHTSEVEFLMTNMNLDGSLNGHQALVRKIIESDGTVVILVS